MQTEVTWLLKKYLENKKEITGSDSSTIWQSLTLINHWGAKLHVLQCLPLIEIAIPDKDLIETFLRKNFGSKNKFVRAWSYSGFYELANQFPEYRKEAVQLIENAILTESASVKARLRYVKKNGFWVEQW